MDTKAITTKLEKDIAILSSLLHHNPDFDSAPESGDAGRNPSLNLVTHVATLLAVSRSLNPTTVIGNFGLSGSITCLVFSNHHPMDSDLSHIQPYQIDSIPIKSRIGYGADVLSNWDKSIL